eukprot:scaffold730_cov365-Pinguiococcus_pyrenoidosus.AAC.6
MEANLRGRGRSMGKKSSQLPRAHPGSRAADLDRSISTAGTWRVFASDSPLDGSLSVAHVWHGVAFQGYQIGARSFQALPCGAIGVAEDVGWGVQLTDGSTDSPPSLQHSLDEAAASKLSAGYSGKAEASGRWARRRALSTP